MNNQKLKIMKTLDNFSANKLQSQDLAKTKGGCFIMSLFNSVPPGGQGMWHNCSSHALSWMKDCPAGAFHGIIIYPNGGSRWSTVFF